MFDNNNIRHILIPRFDTFGDIILTEGLIERMIARFPSSQITLLVRPGYDQLSLLFPQSLRWMTADLHPYKTFDKIDFNVVSDLLTRLNKLKWDLLVLSTFNRTWIDEIIASGITCDHKIAFGTTMHHHTMIQTLAETIHIAPDFVLESPVLVDEADHETVKYQVLADHLFNDTTPLPRPRLHVAHESKKAAYDLRRNFNFADQNYVVFLPGGLQNNIIKGWPLERYAEIIAWIYNEYHYLPLLIGHENESALLNDVKMLVRAHGIEATLWSGKDGQIPLLAALIESARLFIGNDSGPMHIAATLGVPTIGIFGGGNYQRFLPSGDNAIGIIGEMPCFGCAWDCMFGDAPCIRLVSVSDVKQAVCDIMKTTLLSDRNMLSASNKLTKETSDLIALAKDKYSNLKLYYADKLEHCESDRAGRLKVIKQQAERIGDLDSSVNRLAIEHRFLLQKHKESEEDRVARLRTIDDLQQKWQASEADRVARLEVINDLQQKLHASEADRAARFEVIKDLQNKWQDSEADRAARLEVINQLSVKLQRTEMLCSDARTRLELEKTANLELTSEIGSIKRSLSWRLTAPLRRIAALFRY